MQSHCLLRISQEPCHADLRRIMRSLWQTISAPSVQEKSKIQMSYFALFNNTCYMRGQRTFKTFDRLLQACGSAQYSSPKRSRRRRLLVSGSIAVAEREKEWNSVRHIPVLWALNSVMWPSPVPETRGGKREWNGGGMTALSWRLADMAVSSYKS